MQLPCSLFQIDDLDHPGNGCYVILDADLRPLSDAFPNREEAIIGYLSHLSDLDDALHAEAARFIVPIIPGCDDEAEQETRSE
jgi:hypothetical protein